jgi:hypothetical protein
MKKQYKTRDGHRVINVHEVPFNSVGNLVTFPIKGNVVIKEKPGKMNTTYTIWRKDGRHSIFKETGLDLII